MLVIHSRNGESRTVPPDVEALDLASDIVWVDLLKPDAGRGCRRRGRQRVDPAEPGGTQRNRIVEPAAHRRRRAVPECAAGLSRADAGSRDDPGRLRAGARAAGNGALRNAELVRGLPGYGARQRGRGLCRADRGDRRPDCRVLEHIAAELDLLSHRLFRSRSVGGGERGTRAQENADLRSILRRLGASGDLVSKIRDSLLALARIVPYVATTRGSELPAPVRRVSKRCARTGFAERLRDPSAEQGAAAARRDAGPDQCRAERHHQGADRRVGGRRAADPGREHVRHELQTHARTRMEPGAIPTGWR